MVYFSHQRKTRNVLTFFKNCLNYYKSSLGSKVKQLFNCGNQYQSGIFLLKPDAVINIRIIHRDTMWDPKILYINQNQTNRKKLKLLYERKRQKFYIRFFILLVTPERKEQIKRGGTAACWLDVWASVMKGNKEPLAAVRIRNV